MEIKLRLHDNFDIYLVYDSDIPRYAIYYLQEEIFSSSIEPLHTKLLEFLNIVEKQYESKKEIEVVE